MPTTHTPAATRIKTVDELTTGDRLPSGPLIIHTSPGGGYYRDITFHTGQTVTGWTRNKIHVLT